MHADRILTHVLGSCLTNLHSKKSAALLRATSALLRGNITSLTEIALCLNGDTTLKHRIKSVDRLLGNSGLHLARGALYRNVALRCFKVYHNFWLSWIDETTSHSTRLPKDGNQVAGYGRT